MDYREFIIVYCPNGIEWHIILKEWEYKDGYSADISLPNRALKTGEIAFINDIFAPSAKDLDIYKKEHLLLETCNFIHIDDASSQTIKKFQGTFIDALEYIKDSFR